MNFNRFVIAIIAFAGASCSPALPVIPDHIRQPPQTQAVSALTPLPTATLYDWWAKVGGDSWGVYLVDPSGENLTRLTEKGEHYRYPQFSPDGQYLAFIRYGQAGALLLHNRQSGEQQVVVQGDGRYGAPVWSPDASRVAFVEHFDERAELLVYDFSTEHLMTLVDWEGTLSSPTWSPDSARLAFSGARDVEESEIYVVNADGSDLIQLTATNGRAGLPSWSPTESSLAYNVFTGDYSHEVRMQMMDAGQPRGAPIVLDSTRYPISRPIWSPDGQFVAVGWPTGGGIIDKDTLARTVVVQSVASYEPRGWSGDGTALLFVSSGCCLMGIDFVRVEEPMIPHVVLGSQLDGTNFWQVDAAWAPDEDLIAFSGLLNPPIP